MTRELRSLGDVDVVEQDAIYLMSVVGVSNKLKSMDSPLGHTLSLVLLRSTSPKETFDIAADAFKLSKEITSHLASYFANTYTLVNHLVVTGATVEEMCKSLVAEVDGQNVSKDRATYQQVIDRLKAFKQ